MTQFESYIPVAEVESIDPEGTISLERKARSNDEKRMRDSKRILGTILGHRGPKTIASR